MECRIPNRPGYAVRQIPRDRRDGPVAWRDVISPTELRQMPPSCHTRSPYLCSHGNYCRSARSRWSSGWRRPALHRRRRLQHRSRAQSDTQNLVTEARYGDRRGYRRGRIGRGVGVGIGLGILGRSSLRRPIVRVRATTTTTKPMTGPTTRRPAMRAMRVTCAPRISGRSSWITGPYTTYGSEKRVWPVSPVGDRVVRRSRRSFEVSEAAVPNRTARSRGPAGAGHRGPRLFCVWGVNSKKIIWVDVHRQPQVGRRFG